VPAWCCGPGRDWPWTATGYMQAPEIAPYKLPERLVFADLPGRRAGS
jgi:hypothetical protein